MHTCFPAAISGYEVPIVIMAVGALVLLCASALLGTWLRFVRSTSRVTSVLRRRGPHRRRSPGDG